MVREIAHKCLFFGEITGVDGPGDGVRPFEQGKMCHG
jgi:hypothetical protein